MKRRDELLVGLLLLVAVTLLLGGTLWIARGGLQRGYPMYARFPWGAGLNPGQQVLLAGVQVGFVDRVELIPDGTLAVKLSIRDEYGIPVGTTASVEPNGLFGDQLIALTPVRASTTYMEHGDTIPAGRGAPSMQDLVTKGDSIAITVGTLTNEIRAEYVEGKGIAESRQAIAEMTKLVRQLSTIAAEQSRQLSITQAELRNRISAVDSARLDATMQHIRVATNNLEELSRELRATNTQFQTVVDKVSNGNGSVARFLNDPSLFARLDTVLMRVDTITQDLKANPRKYINLRIF